MRMCIVYASWFICQVTEVAGHCFQAWMSVATMMPMSIEQDPLTIANPSEESGFIGWRGSQPLLAHTYCLRAMVYLSKSHLLVSFIQDFGIGWGFCSSFAPKSNKCNTSSKFPNRSHSFPSFWLTMTQTQTSCPSASVKSLLNHPVVEDFLAATVDRSNLLGNMRVEPRHWASKTSG